MFLCNDFGASGVFAKKIAIFFICSEEFAFLPSRVPSRQILFGSLRVFLSG
jgi:hypothetical protein